MEKLANSAASMLWTPGPLLKLHLYGVLCSCVEPDEDQVARAADLSLKSLPILWYRKIRKGPFIPQQKTFASALKATCYLGDCNDSSSPSQQAERRTKALMSKNSYSSYVPIEATLEVVDESSGPYLWIKSNGFQFVDDEDDSALSGMAEGPTVMSKKIRMDSIDSITAATDGDWGSNNIDGVASCGIVINGLSKRGEQPKLLMFEIISGSSLGRMKRDDAVQNLRTVLLWNRMRRNEDPFSEEREAYRNHIAGDMGAFKEELNDTQLTESSTDEESIDVDTSGSTVDTPGSTVDTPGSTVDTSGSTGSHFVLDQDEKGDGTPPSLLNLANTNISVRELKEDWSPHTPTDRSRSSSKRRSHSRSSRGYNPDLAESEDSSPLSTPPDRSHTSSKRRSHSRSSRGYNPELAESEDSPPHTPTDRSRSSSKRRSYSRSSRGYNPDLAELEDSPPHTSTDRSRSSSKRRSHSRSSRGYNPDLAESEDNPLSTPPDRSRSSSKRRSHSRSSRSHIPDLVESEDSPLPTPPDSHSRSSRSHMPDLIESEDSSPLPTTPYRSRAPSKSRSHSRSSRSHMPDLVESEDSSILSTTDRSRSSNLRKCFSGSRRQMSSDNDEIQSRGFSTPPTTPNRSRSSYQQRRSHSVSSRHVQTTTQWTEFPSNVLIT